MLLSNSTSKDVPQSPGGTIVIYTDDNIALHQRNDKCKYYLLFYIGIITLFLGVYFFIALTFLNSSSYLAVNSEHSKRTYASDQEIPLLGAIAKQQCIHKDSFYNRFGHYTSQSSTFLKPVFKKIASNHLKTNYKTILS
ncbi:hypothetical protein [Aquimarina sp. MMG016]|uniref:hypothetical protein n=1 Tax=Aquimarina sp. MMG016 TaxID=2822690 RepID=UPI001B3A0146|nr:hypothetical protein [Aquimarina sp. MMG016]MBQ4821732.1 hypothetical protein [Aquimarina sp. MMG016]